MSIYHKQQLIAGNSSEAQFTTFDDIYPIGSIYLSLNADLPASFLLHGTWEIIGSGRCLMGANVEGTDVGQNKDAGLPIPVVNDPGHIHSYNYYNEQQNVAQVGSGTDASYQYITGNTTSVKTGITIQKDSIYGNSDTVQPPAVIVRMWRRRS